VIGSGCLRWLGRKRILRCRTQIHSFWIGEELVRISGLSYSFIKRRGIWNFGEEIFFPLKNVQVLSDWSWKRRRQCSGAMSKMRANQWFLESFSLWKKLPCRKASHFVGKKQRQRLADLILEDQREMAFAWSWPIGQRFWTLWYDM